MIQMRRLQEEAGPDWLHLQVLWLNLAAKKKQLTFEVKSYFSLSQLSTFVAGVGDSSAPYIDTVTNTNATSTTRWP